MNKNQFNTSEYVDQMMLLLDWDLPNEYHHGVVENFQRIEEIFLLVNEFPLPENIQAAPVFEP
ncbi:MAG: DUF4089 domain-containing protein [Cyanobacteria bacterium P01_A01_bin.84]